MNCCMIRVMNSIDTIPLRFHWKFFREYNEHCLIDLFESVTLQNSLGSSISASSIIYEIILEYCVLLVNWVIHQMPYDLWYWCPWKCFGYLFACIASWNYPQQDSLCMNQLHHVHIFTIMLGILGYLWLCYILAKVLACYPQWYIWGQPQYGAHDQRQEQWYLLSWNVIEYMFDF